MIGPRRAVSLAGPRVGLFAAACAALAATACGSSAPDVHPLGELSPAGRPEVYAALGASETAGVGIPDQPLRLRAAWPQLFFNEALPRAATYYNFAVPGITTQEALQAEVGAALAVRPTVVTVFFSIDDLVRGVSAADYETNLGVIVHDLSQGGRATVLVANAPSIDRLPAYQACLGGLADCPVRAQVDTIPPPSVVAGLVAAYDAAVGRVAAREGARVVDLLAHSGDLVDHPEDVAPDGFHPSSLGAAEIARLFAAAYTHR